MIPSSLPPHTAAPADPTSPSQPSPLKRLVWKPLTWILASVLVVGQWFALPAAWATSLYQLPAAPTEATWVLDEPEVLSRLTAIKLRDELKSIAKDTGTEVRMVIISRVEYGQTIQGFMDELLETWYPTPEQQANKVIVGIDILSNSTAIAVGEGSNPSLDSETVASIASTTLAYPAQDGGRYNQALYATQERLSAILSGQGDPGEPQVASEVLNNVNRTYATAEETEGSNATTIVIVVLVIATVVPMVTYFAYALR
ncbi:MAG: photosystem II repair protein Psb32 [Prochlorothrix sp.]